MKTFRLIDWIKIAPMFVASVLLVGCGDGADVDNDLGDNDLGADMGDGMDNMGDGMNDAGDAIGDATDDTIDATDDALDNAGDALDEATEDFDDPIN